MKTVTILRLSFLVVLITLLCIGPVGAEEPSITAQAALGTAFTYQGQLTDGGSPANGPYDFEFRLYDGSNPATATQVGSAVSCDDVSVSNGFFTVSLDFGAGIFNGTALWLQASVRPGASTGSYQALAPLTAINAAPYALALRWGANMQGGSQTVTGLSLSGAVPWSNGILKVTNSANGPSLWGVNTGGGNGVRGYGFGNSIGVYGEGESGQGVIGRSTSNTGVSGLSVDGYGVTAHSDNNHSLYIDGAGASGVYVGGAGHNGIEVQSAGWDGITVWSANWSGI